MAHRLDPLVNPTSIAVVGASRREGSGGFQVLRNLLEGGFTGAVYAINPGYDDILGVPCYGELAAVPEPVQHVVFAVGDGRIEAAFVDAVAHGAAAATIFSPLVLENDAGLADRIGRRARDAGMLLAGGNGMGFYNFAGGVRVSAFETRTHRRSGNVALLSQSGSGMAGILDVDERIDLCFASSTGQELVVGVEDYLDYVLDLPELAVVGLFLETCRQPAMLRRALEKARTRQVPVVALKVGRTERAAASAISHTGALAGNDAAYAALFDHYGVQRVGDMDELATALIMFAQPGQVAGGGLVSLHDSGGEQQLIIDLADRFEVPLTELADDTVTALEPLLDPGLAAVNPVDGWSAGGPDADANMARIFALLMNDPGTALGAVVHDRAPGGGLFGSYRDYLRAGREASGKPVFLVANRQGAGSDPRVLEWTREGLPVLDGVAPFLAGARALLGYRDFRAREDETGMLPEAFELSLPAGVGDEHGAARLLADAGIPMVESDVVESATDLERIATSCAYPVVLKTAMPGIAHKADVGGVVLGIADAVELTLAYTDLVERLGPRALVAPMIEAPGCEMILGISRDPDFGPLVALGTGGVHAEALGDVVFALPPFSQTTARRCVDRLRLRALLEGLDTDAFCAAAARLSQLAVGLPEQIAAIDINPVKVLARSCVGLDALLIWSDAVERNWE